MEKYSYLFSKVSSYTDMEDYDSKTFDGVEQLEEQLEDGSIQEMTRGVYNGALDTFTPNTLNAEELAGALQLYLHEIDWVSTLYQQHEDADDLETFEHLTVFDVLEDYLNTFAVFTIGNRIFVNFF